MCRCIYVFSNLFTIHFLRSGASSSGNSILLGIGDTEVEFAKDVFVM